MEQIKQRNPWWWIPTLYIGEGLPNVVVMTVAVVMYMQLGMSDTDIALYTGWLGLPWVVKPLWSPFVDLYKTKRWWVLAMQMLLGSSLAGVAFTLNTPFWFQGTMCFFFLMAFSSATHDIAADGYYMLELDDHQQVWFVGIRNTFYRLAVIFGNGVLIPMAGMLQLVFRNQKAFTWSLVFYGLAALFLAIWLYHAYIMPRSKADQRHGTNAREVATGIVTAFRTFFQKLPPREMLFAMLFLLFYRFPEALLGKMSVTFLMRPHSSGGLGLSPQEFGLASGTIGVIGLTLGGILGGLLAGRDGFKRWLWPMVCAITLPDITHQLLHLHRTVWLWTGLYSTDTLHALLRKGQFPDVSLCLLYCHLLSGFDVAWYGVGMDEGFAGLPSVLYHCHAALSDNVCRDSTHQG